MVVLGEQKETEEPEEVTSEELFITLPGLIQIPEEPEVLDI